jgi:hypothetical protein
MNFTGLEIVAWIAVYFGVGLIEASLRSSERNSTESDLITGFRFPGYGLLVVGVLVLGIELF